MNQFEKFLSKENFFLAYSRIKTTGRNEYKEFYYDDFRVFEYYFDENIEFLIEEITEGNYEPMASLRYYIPKKQNLARPVSLLSLIDLIVYQAIGNIVAEAFVGEIEASYNIDTFGNLINTETNSIFFFRPWREQLKKYRKKIIKEYDKGLTWVAQFDIASFYDTIDHGILLSLLKQVGIDEHLIVLLDKCLKKWAQSSNKLPFEKDCGIPQGPVTSGLFSEVMLFHIQEIVKEKCPKVTILRYVDDITIMDKERVACERAIVFLDIVCRDFSLIPQTSKIEIKNHLLRKDFVNLVSNGGIKFSEIANEYKRRFFRLNAKTHSKLKRRLIETLNSNCDKTIIRFSLFRLNEDEEIRDALINSIDELQLFLPEILFYFNKYYVNDKAVIDAVKKIVRKDAVVFHYSRSLVFKYAKLLSFDSEIFNDNKGISDFRWIVKYRLLDWLKKHERNDLAEFVDNEDQNYFIDRYLCDLKFSCCTDCTMSDNLLEEYCKKQNLMLGLHALANMTYFVNSKQTIKRLEESQNGFVKNILKLGTPDFCIRSFEKVFGIQIYDEFYNLLKQDIDRFVKLKECFRQYLNNTEPALRLLNLDLINNIIFDLICEKRGVNTDTDFGGRLASITTDLPFTFYAFKKVHEMRCVATPAHYKDKYGKVSKEKTTSESLTKLIDQSKIKKAYIEINSFFNI